MSSPGKRPSEKKLPGKRLPAHRWKENHRRFQKREEEIVMMKASAQSFLDGVFRAMELPVDIHHGV